MRRLHRAWTVCLGCTLMLLVSGGLCINAFSVTQPYILAQNGFTNTETSMITTACPVTFLLCMFGIGASLTTVGLSVWAADFSCAERRAQSVQRFSALLRHRRACLFVHARHGGRSHGQLRACVRDFCAFRRLFDSDRPVDLPARKQSPNLNARAIFLKL